MIQSNPELYFYQELDEINYNLLNRYKLVALLSSHPKLYIYCNLNKLNDYNWSYVLNYQPQLAEFCNCKNWRMLLTYHPELAKYRK